MVKQPQRFAMSCSSSKKTAARLCAYKSSLHFSSSSVPPQHSSTPFSASLLSSSKTLITGFSLHCHSSVPVSSCVLVFFLLPVYLCACVNCMCVYSMLAFVWFISCMCGFKYASPCWCSLLCFAATHIHGGPPTITPNDPFILFKPYFIMAAYM